MCISEKSTALSKYFEAKLAVIEVNEGETQEEALRRYLTANPEYANSHIKVFHYPPRNPLKRAKEDENVLPFKHQEKKIYG